MRRKIKKIEFSVFWGLTNWAFRIDNNFGPFCRFIEFGPFMLAIIYKKEE